MRDTRFIPENIRELCVGSLKEELSRNDFRIYEGGNFWRALNTYLVNTNGERYFDPYIHSTWPKEYKESSLLSSEIKLKSRDIKTMKDLILFFDIVEKHMAEEIKVLNQKYGVKE